MGDFGEDSDDSDGEGGLGNVNRQIMRPPGHSGKAKRGHLCFDASFECGNLGRVDLVNEYEYDLFIRPDTCSPRLRFWFNFTVDNVKLDQRVIFNIVNISKERNLFMENMTPLVKSSSRPRWQRIPKKHVFYHRSNVHSGHYVLSFSFGFDKEEDVFQFAVAPPYSYAKLQTFLTMIEKRAAHLNENFTRELLANSVQKRRVDIITIGSLQPLEKTSKPKAKRRIVCIMARVHPGETPASFVCQGLLELLISSNSIASILRENVTFKVIPMLNPDGVFLGNYRSNVIGSDLNRSWHIANQWIHPTIKAVLDTLTILDKSKEFQLDFVVDIHAHTSLTGCFMYGNTYEDVYRYERHILFPKLLATTADDYVPGNTMFNSDSNKLGTSRRFLCSVLGDKVNCYTFEVSIFGYRLKGSEPVIPYTEESYMRCGRNLVRTFLEYYQNTGAIPIQLASEVSSKKRYSRKSQIRIRNKNYQRIKTPLTTRTQAQLHFTNININYDSETSLEDCSYSYRNGSPIKAFDRITEQYNLRKSAKSISQKPCNFRSGSPLPTTFVVLPEPSLTVIDFNIISRDDIDRVTKINKIKREFQLDFVVDIHAHTSLTGCFMYGNTYEDVYRYERHILFPKLLATTADDYVPGNTMFNSDSNKLGTSRRFLCSVLGDKVNCYTFEVSIFGYRLKGSEPVIPYTEESYMRCGRNLVRTFLEYYQNTGAIPIQLASEVSSKKRYSRKSQIRIRNKNYQRIKTPLTTRTQAQLHFTNININYDSETSLEDCSYSYRNGSPIKAFDRITEQYNLRKSAKSISQKPCNFRSGSPLPTTFVVLPEPSLTVIDFNIISRDDIDRVTKINKIKRVS